MQRGRGPGRISRRPWLWSLFAVAACGRQPLMPASGVVGASGVAGASGASGLAGAPGASGAGGRVPSGAAGGSGGGGAPGTGGDARDSSVPAPDASPLPPGPRAAGAECAVPADCASTFCVDGVCCSSPCTTICTTCVGPGTAGTCTPLPAGTPTGSPGDCFVSPMAPCSHDGTCDGRGGCRVAPAGTSCGRGTCQGSTIVGRLACDGQGACAPAAALSCAPFPCDATTASCSTKCATPADCGGKPCVGGACSLVASCAANGECASGFCSDGVCCDKDCGGACMSCALPGRTGKCTLADRGTPDPHGMCNVDAPATCGRNGTCDGMGFCAGYALGTVCGPPTCLDGTVSPAQVCNGQGTCDLSPQSSCAPFTCDAGGTRCGATCTGSDAQCPSGSYCAANDACMPRKAFGTSCASDHECFNGACLAGTCGSRPLPP